MLRSNTHTLSELIKFYKKKHHLEQGINETRLIEIMEENRKEVNLSLAKYMQVAKIKIYPEEFEKTPKRSIKRYLYTAADL